MTKALRWMLIALALLLMGARDLPRPCIGDGQGNPCAINLCQCTALCSCRSVCGSDAAESSDSGPSCHMHASADAASPGHFTLPEPQNPTLLPAAASPWLPQVAPDVLAFAPKRYPPPNLLPPDPPPQIRA